MPWQPGPRAQAILIVVFTLGSAIMAGLLLGWIIGTLFDWVIALVLAR